MRGVNLGNMRFDGNPVRFDSNGRFDGNGLNMRLNGNGLNMRFDGRLNGRFYVIFYDASSRRNTDTTSLSRRASCYRFMSVSRVGSAAQLKAMILRLVLLSTLVVFLYGFCHQLGLLAYFELLLYQVCLLLGYKMVLFLLGKLGLGGHFFVPLTFLVYRALMQEANLYTLFSSEDSASDESMGSHSPLPLPPTRTWAPWGEFDELAPMVDPFLNPRVTEAQGPHQPAAESTSGDESSSSVEEYAENSHSSGTAEAEAPMFNEDPLPQFRIDHLAEEEALVTRVRVLEGQLGYFVLPQEEEGGYEKLLLDNFKNAASVNQSSYEWILEGETLDVECMELLQKLEDIVVDKFLRDPSIEQTLHSAPDNMDFKKEAYFFIVYYII